MEQPDGAEIIAAELTELDQIVDPVARARRAGELIAKSQHRVREMARIRRESWRELVAQGWTHAQIADYAGISTARVGQIVSAGRSPAPETPGTRTTDLALDLDELFGDHRVMVILRGLPPAETVAAAGQAWDAGVGLLEVPIGQADQVPALAAAVAAGAERGRLVGAGTVIAVEQVDAATAAGAAYTVAPGYDPAVVAASSEAGLPHLPGVATAGEVQRARAGGCRWVKVFPASTLGPGWIAAMRGPFPDVRYLATGGIAVAAAPDYLGAGARVVAFGSDRVDQLAELVARVEGPGSP